jgi:hypothetical protein
MFLSQVQALSGLFLLEPLAVVQVEHAAVFEAEHARLLVKEQESLLTYPLPNTVAAHVLVRMTAAPTLEIIRKRKQAAAAAAAAAAATSTPPSAATPAPAAVASANGRKRPARSALAGLLRPPPASDAHLTVEIHHNFFFTVREDVEVRFPPLRFTTVPLTEALHLFEPLARLFPQAF